MNYVRLHTCAESGSCCCLVNLFIFLNGWAVLLSWYDIWKEESKAYVRGMKYYREKRAPYRALSQPIALVAVGTICKKCLGNIKRIRLVWKQPKSANKINETAKKYWGRDVLAAVNSTRFGKEEGSMPTWWSAVGVVSCQSHAPGRGAGQHSWQLGFLVAASCPWPFGDIFHVPWQVCWIPPEWVQSFTRTLSGAIPATGYNSKYGKALHTINMRRVTLVTAVYRWSAIYYHRKGESCGREMGKY